MALSLPFIRCLGYLVHGVHTTTRHTRPRGQHCEEATAGQGHPQASPPAPQHGRGLPKPLAWPGLAGAPPPAMSG